MAALEVIRCISRSFFAAAVRAFSPIVAVLGVAFLSATELSR
jgi:hypothetical protein